MIIRFMRWYRQLKDYRKVALWCVVATAVPFVGWQFYINDLKTALYYIWVSIIGAGVIYAIHGWINDV